MAQFVVRNIEDDVHQRLRELAQSREQSLEEFVRELLREVALNRDEPIAALGTRIVSRFSKCGLTEPIQELRGHAACPSEFDQ